MKLCIYVHVDPVPLDSASSDSVVVTLPSSFGGEAILLLAEVLVEIAVGLGIFDPLLWGEVGDLGGSDFAVGGRRPSALDLPGDCGDRGVADVESAEVSALIGAGILEMGRGILLPLLLVPAPDWSDDSGCDPGEGVVVEVEISVERLF